MTREEFDDLLEEYGYGVHIEYKQLKRRLIREEFSRMAVANELMLAALRQVEHILHISGDSYCAWCRAPYPQHRLDCPRQTAILAATTPAPPEKKSA